MKFSSNLINRRGFLKAGVSFAAFTSTSNCFTLSPEPSWAAIDRLQLENDLVSREDYLNYLKDGDTRSLAALKRLDRVVDKVFKEVTSTAVTDPNKPAIWYVYNMGIIVKTTTKTFSIDLVHRRASEFAPILDFALITHNHGDHWQSSFYTTMSDKTVVSNFLDNYGVKNWRENGGFTRAAKTFTFGDVTVKTGLCDHNAYLVDFTTFFEIHIGEFTLCHSGDCGNPAKLKFTKRPDLWMVHPYCGLDVVKASTELIHPKKVLIGHIEELTHPKNQWRWSYGSGMKVKENLEADGIGAKFSLWGDRVM
jgi:hypothetical protein